jgi:Fis family transcriptional regulator
MVESAAGLGNGLSVEREHLDEPLRECVRIALGRYFEHLDGHKTQDLYALVMAEVEQPMLSTVMQHCGGNQTLAAEILGISRSTLRKKLAQHNLGH